MKTEILIRDVNSSVGETMRVAGFYGAVCALPIVPGNVASLRAVAPPRASNLNSLILEEYLVTNVKGFRAFGVSVPVLLASEYLAFAWSTQANDFVTVADALQLFCKEIEDGPAVLKVGTLSAYFGLCMTANKETTIYGDGADTIKTISATVVKLGSPTPAASILYELRVWI